jgi:hypothetical protein
MDITTFCTPLVNHLTLSETERKERDSFVASLDYEDRVILWELLDAAFLTMTPEEDWNYRMDYLRWYTLLTWQRLRSMTPKMVSEIAFPRQLAMAVLLEFDPVSELMYYVDQQPMEREETEQFYTDLQKNMKDSAMVVGLRQEKPMLFSEVVQNIERINREDNSLRSAEFFTQCKDFFFIKNDAAIYSSADPDEATSKIIDIAQFILGVAPENFPALAKVSLHADEYELLSQKNVAEKSPSEDASSTNLPPVTLPPEIVEALKPVPVRPSNLEIKKIIEEDVQSLAISDPMSRAEAVMTRLDRLAEYYRDESLRQLFYYNESDGQFYWNEELLK